MRLFTGICCKCNVQFYYSVSNVEDFFKIKCFNCKTITPFIEWEKLFKSKKQHKKIIKQSINRLLILCFSLSVYNIFKIKRYLCIIIVLSIYLYMLDFWSYLSYPYYKYLFYYQINIVIKQMGVLHNDDFSEKIKNYIEKQMYL